jgi:hypothetical protein
MSVTRIGDKQYPRVDKKDGSVKPPRIEIETGYIPRALAELPRWVCWKWIWREDDKGKGSWTKPPINAKTGNEAKTNDPTTWVTYSEAMAAYRLKKEYAGVGFVFCDDDGIMGVDVDGCLWPCGSLTPTAEAAVQHFGDSYCEVSPSGAGLKFIIQATIPGGKSGRKNPKLDVEAYQSGRYFTVTGRRWPGSSSSILWKQKALDQWSESVFRSAKVDDKTDNTPATPVSAGVMEIVEKASASRNGDKFRKLWAGDCSEFNDDQSSGDLAFCSMLAFWCGGNANLIDEVFRASGLMREKWEREDYRTGTIKKAVDGCREFYPWDRQGSKKSFVSNVIESCNPDPEADQEPDPEPDPDSQAWPNLIPIAGPEPEPMECSDFPPCIAGIIEAVVEFAEVPVELPGLMALGVLATASQKKYEIAGDGSYREPLNLFVCPALDPGNRKTSVVAILTKPLRRWEQDQRAELAPIIREAESERRTAEKRIEHLRTKASKAEDSVERTDLQREIDAVERELPPVPVMPLLTTDDCTPEHTATLLSHHGERLAIVSDEGGIFDIVAGRYSRGVPNLDVFLQAHAGSPVRVHRGSREPVDLQNPCLTIAISCQPYVLAEMGDNKAFRGRGLLARFLFAIPKSNLGFRTLQPKEIPSPQLDAWHHVVYTMLDREQQVDDFGDPKSQILYLSPGAYRLWKSEQRSNETDMRPAGSWADNTGWASKYPGAVLRIAGILHCADCTSCGQDPATQDVEESTMRFALQLGRKIKSHSRQAFGMMALTDDQKFAHKIVEWIRRDSITEFTGRECSIHCNSAGSVKELDEAFELLINHGWIRPGQKKQPDGGGRPSQPFEVNPAVAQLDDKTDETHQLGISQGVLSVLSSVSAKPIPRPELLESEPVDVDDYEFSFPSDRRG